MLNLRLACTTSYLDKEQARQERTEWVSCVVWGKRGEGLAKVLAKGSRIYLEGELRSSSYDDKEGIKRYRTEVHASSVVFAGDADGAPRGERRVEQSRHDDRRPTGRIDDRRGPPPRPTNARPRDDARRPDPNDDIPF